MRPKLSFANVVSVLALFVAIGGTAFAFHLGKNSIGSRQLKKSAVTTAKVKNEAITAAKVKKGTLTGAQINSSTLGTVPTAQSAQSADTIAPSEGWHEVTEFLHGWESSMPAVGGHPEPVAFYKDKQGIVHFRGEVSQGTPNTAIFRLPPGYRPASGHFIQEPVACFGGVRCPYEVNSVTITGPNFPSPVGDGVVLSPAETQNVFLDGISFRAES
jgi:hypothetical protein